MKTTALSIALTALLLFAAPLTSHADGDAGKVMDLKYENAPVLEVIADIAHRAGANVIVSPNVKGAITLDLHGVPWRKALEIVARTTGSRVVEEDHGILRVIPSAPKRHAALAPARMEKLNEARARLAEMEARVAKAKAEQDERRVGSLTRRLDKERERFAALRKHFGVSEAAWRVLEARGQAQNAKPKAHTTTVTQEGGQTVIITLDEHGRVITKGVVKPDPKTGRIVLDNGDVIHVGPTRNFTLPLLAGVPLLGDPEIVKARKRIEDLTAAMKHLQAAGAQDEAKRLHARLAEAKAALDVAKKRRAEAQAQAERARLKVRLSPGTITTGSSKRGDANLAGSIQALRKDVNALRGEVRELTGLVRQLLSRGGAGR